MPVAEASKTHPTSTKTNIKTNKAVLNANPFYPQHQIKLEHKLLHNMDSIKQTDMSTTCTPATGTDVYENLHQPTPTMVEQLI